MTKTTKTKTRATNGMGSVRKRSDGRWEARYSTPSGDQKSIYGKTEKEVAQKLRETLHSIDTGKWQEPSRLTVSDWLDIWLRDYQTDTSERTAYKYRCIADKHYKKHIGDVRLTKLMPYHIRRMITAMQEEGLAATTIHNYLAILETAIQRAVEHRLISENPVCGISLKSDHPKDFCIIDREDIPRFLEAVHGMQYENELKIMLFTGLRVGEVRGLRWSDTDLNVGTFDIQRQIQPKRKDMQQVTLPKYNKTRQFHIPKDAVDALRDQKRKQAEQRLKAGDEWIETDISADLVFRLPNGRPHGEHTLYFAVKKLGEAMGMPDLHPHDLRHSYAIAALRSGVDVKTVQHNLGHKTATMTLEVYAAYTNDAGRKGAEKLSEYLEDAKK